MLEHAATLLDMGKAIDHYERFEHAAMIVTTADLAGFTHEALGILSAILRHAGGDTSLGPYARLIPLGDRPAVRRAAVALALAEELNRRIPPREPAPLRCTWGPVRGRGPGSGILEAQERHGTIPGGLRSETLDRASAGHPAAPPGHATRLGRKRSVRLIRRRAGEPDTERRPATELALDINAPVVLDHMLHDREPESCAACLSRASPVDAIEALEDPGMSRDGIPIPVSLTRRVTSSPSESTRTVTLPPSWL